MLTPPTRSRLARLDSARVDSGAGPKALALALAALACAASGPACAPLAPARSPELLAASGPASPARNLVPLASVSRQNSTQDPLPTGWDTCGPRRFETLLAEWEAGNERVLSSASKARLRRTLEDRDALSVRAVLLLKNAEGGHLERIRHLEQRVPATSRALDASDVVAAASLTRERRDEIPRRLAILALPGSPHPDLEVRAECARAALLSGRTEVVRFLLQVLRAGTRDEALDPPDWERVQTLAWVKSRTAEVLSWRAGEAVEFRPDGSFEHQEMAARRFAELLAADL